MDGKILIPLLSKQANKLFFKLCLRFVAIKDYFTRLKGTPITAGKMKEIESVDGDIRIFAGGKTVINAHEEDIPNANITRVPAVLVQSRSSIFLSNRFSFRITVFGYFIKCTPFAFCIWTEI